MMADWQLADVRRDLERLPGRLHLLGAEGDRFIPPSLSRTLAREIDGAHFVSLGRLGHLAHEEAPAEVAQVILSIAGSQPGQSHCGDKQQDRCMPMR